MNELNDLADFLLSHPAVSAKAHAHRVYEPAYEISGNIRLGDDCAAIPNPSGPGYLLFAAKCVDRGMVEDDPYFAGYSAVRINLSNVAAMGGRPTAIVNVMWSESEEVSAAFWKGIQAASEAYGVPVVGGDTRWVRPGGSALGAAVVGHAGERLMSSFEAKPGDHLMLAIDMHGAYRDGGSLWDAGTRTPAERLRANLELLPSLAEKGLCKAGRDIGGGGIAGTLAMMCATSGVGAVLDLERLPCPMDTEMGRWLVTVPTYGFLLAVAPEDLEMARMHFTATKVTFRAVGRFRRAPGITLTADGASAMLFPGEPGIDAAGHVLHAGESLI